MWSWGIDKVWATSHVGPKRFTPAGAGAGLGWGEPGQVDLGCSTAVSRKRPGCEKGIPRPNGGCSDVGRVLRTENLEQGER